MSNNKNNYSFTLTRLKNTMTFSLKEGIFNLFKALSIFTLRGMHVTKIKSHTHNKNTLHELNEEEDWGTSCMYYLKYVFFINLEANLGNNHLGNAKRALDKLQSIINL
jgi:prephenate dehydratase